MNDPFELKAGDCLKVMSGMDGNSIDAIVTDPPYGLGFMGKEWDHGVPGTPFWEAALRVLKPGGHLLAFGGTRTYHRLGVAIEDAGFEIRDCLSWLYGQGFPKSRNIGKDLAEWEGWGTALKPAWEPIILARKPFKGTVANNVQTHGTAALNIAATRIPTDDNLGGGAYAQNPTERDQLWGEDAGNSWKRGGAGEFEQPEGRWPANVVLDTEAAAALDEQTGVMKDGVAVQRHGGGQAIFGGIAGNQNQAGAREDSGYGGSGGASRFFYCPKASKKDKGEGNKHPTVKPTDLMGWLVRLVTPPGGIVLDPFAGSGSTGVAALREGFRFVGIECEVEYLGIMARRLVEALEGRTT